ncbi:cysteine-rich protein 2-binding protein-like [Physella acuta]|uniref:cysteine-rich protein 2-binding protein-like n=1 Tax=Physella acuta TaxID=109671 RepID=UPI0027DB0859|nr:cysteine-rich protein 2-binding protein-like [Physella acuta]
MNIEDSTFSSCAYCWKAEKCWDKIVSFKCDGCGKKVHSGCIKSLLPSPLLDDTFFKFKCDSCGENGQEEFQRCNISWHNVVMLALYNLHKMGQGKCGYFHWKGHICAFIEANWTTFFGHQRKKTTLWMGTVAGTLSLGCPDYFISGTKVVEQGYWRLAVIEPPLCYTEIKKSKQKKKPTTQSEIPINLYPEDRKCRKVKENSLVAAIQLKEKRSSLLENKAIKKQKMEEFTNLRDSASCSKKKMNRKQKTLELEPSSSVFTPIDLPSDISLLSDQDSCSRSSSELSLSTASSFTSSARDLPPVKWENGIFDDDLNTLQVEIGEDEEMDVDIGSMVTITEDTPDLRPSTPDLDDIFNMNNGKSPVKVKEEPKTDSDSDGSSENSEEDEDDDGERESGDETDLITRIKQENLTDEHSLKRRKGRPRKRRRLDDAQPPSPQPRLKRISVFEEVELLQTLNDLSAMRSLDPELAQFRRKLICNQTNREFGLPIFDLEIQMDRLSKIESTSFNSGSGNKPFFPHIPSKVSQTKETRDLDRFMIHGSIKKTESRNYTSFHQRIVGLADYELKPLVSPYTTRVLLPFIWRNYNPKKKPLKMKLLEEIQAYPHRKNPSWAPPSTPPLDYCYVRLEHIPSVNALCREFFWPGIDMSECLQYPDFSCVVLYRKIVIAFAFMVPDRGYNEAYISFIFTHPEWRGAGIATFMLYHLIQTCMGKDVLLHVSATNTAMLLYQRFGFKCQEFILNFYHKYFPVDAKDSKHAFLMRLSR